MALEGLRHGQPLGLAPGIGGGATIGKLAGSRRFRGQLRQRHRIGHHRLIGGLRSVPFEHGEFGCMQRPALAAAIHPGEHIDQPFPGREQLLAGEFRRGVEIEMLRRAVGPVSSALTP